MLTILWNQMLRFWGNPNKVATKPKVDPERLLREQDEQDIEDIVLVLNCFLRCQR